MPTLPKGLELTEEQIQAAREAGAEWAKGETHGLPALMADAIGKIDAAVTGEKERAALAWEMLEGHRMVLAGEWREKPEADAT